MDSKNDKNKKVHLVKLKLERATQARTDQTNFWDEVVVRLVRTVGK